MIRRCVFVLGCLVIVTGSVFAQSIPIHGHPEKAAYGSPSEWPTRSAQCHWRNGSPMLGHIHFDLTAPFDGELTGPQVVPFALKLFMVDGHASIDSLEGAYGVIWDATGTAAAPPLLGDPTGLKVWTGHLTLDPTLPTRWHTDHGWWSPLLSIKESLNNGDSVMLQVIPAFYALLNPTAPMTGGAPTFYSARCAPAPTNPGIVRYGANIVETSSPLPIAPTTAIWTVPLVLQGYGTVGLADAVFQQRVDLDLHNGIPGTILKSVTGSGDFNTSITIDPAVIGAGSHKMALFRNQHTLDNTQEVNTLLVFDVVVGSSVPPPPGPVNCVVGPWGTVSVSTTDTPAVTSGNLQTRTETTVTQQSRAILTQPANGGTACPTN